MDMKAELGILKDIVEIECGDKVRAVFAEKPGWLLLKTVNKMKTVGCIRINKNSFVTLYLDTKENHLLQNELLELELYRDRSINIQSRPTGNFVQNKIKLFSEDQADMITQAINFVFDKDIVKVEKRIRHLDKEGA